LRIDFIQKVLHLNPASVKFTEDLPPADRYKTAKVQRYYDTPNPCQCHRFGTTDAALRVNYFQKPHSPYDHIQIGMCHTNTTFLYFAEKYNFLFENSLSRFQVT